MQHIYIFYNIAIPTIIDQIKVDLVKILGDHWRGKTWFPQHPNYDNYLHKRGKRDDYVTNVARETTMWKTWQERR
jgi:hypothetical protein